MSKQAILAITIGVIIVLGISAVLLYSQINQDAEESITTEQKQESMTNEDLTPETLVDLLSKGENAKCTFSTQSEEGNSSGTIYVSGENARAEFETSIDEKTISSNIIRSGDTFYMWGDTLETGIKMEMDINEWAQSASEAQSGESSASFDPKAKVDYKCSAWTVDSTLFSPPTDIKFISFEGLMMPTGAIKEETKTPEAMREENSGIQCSLCDSLSGNAKTLCLQNCQ